MKRWSPKWWALKASGIVCLSVGFQLVAGRFMTLTDVPAVVLLLIGADLMRSAPWFKGGYSV